VCRIEYDSLPLHAILLGHEVGHLNELHSDITSNLKLPIPDKLFPDEIDTPDSATLRAIFAQKRASWIGEVLDDIFSVFLIRQAAIEVASVRSSNPIL
jgi:hypothetical protein